MKGAVTALILGATVQAALAQTGVTQIKLWTDPVGARVRPQESIAVQVRAYGQIQKDSGETQIVRLNRGGATLKIKEDEPVSTETAPIHLQVEGEPDTAASPAEPGPIHLSVEGDHGWVSKPFRFQGTDTETFYQEGLSQIGSIFSSITKEYVLQDAFLYTAPETPGRYELDAELEGAKTSIEIEVTPEAPSTRKPEKFSFPAEDRSGQPYRALAEHWAPVLAQETWFTPKADFPARFDFDGNWRGNDNWNDLEEGSSQAYVHYAAMETATHWFLIYNVFHPRDYSDKCVIGTCHENDNEGLILTIRRDGSEFGRLQAMETLAHNNVYSFVNDDRIGNGIHNVDGRIEFSWDGHPIVFIESGGHGIYGTSSEHSRYDAARDQFTDGTGVTFIYRGEAERPRFPNDREVGYELLPIYQVWWSKAYEGSGWTEPTFDDYFNYQPFGGRPHVPYAMIGGSFLGREEAENKAKPFWGWHDNTTLKQRVLAEGQWGLDPAYAVSRDLRFPTEEPFSLAYTYNPYLGIGR